MFKPRERLVDTPESLTNLVADLENAQKKKKGGSKKTTNTIHKTTISVDSWKFNEWDYGKANIELPIKARGLFILPKKNTIAVRGYDKFFNVNEVDDTKLKNLEKLTSGPYELTLKENGCIIFISGLENGELIVCSKHSTGERDLTRNHALKGEEILLKQLKELNKSPKELATLLYKMNVTAVAEYCDDEFEEHVLPYTKEAAGLYLHGLNFNTIKFNTYDMKSVNEFAEEWGFKKVEFFLMDNFSELWSFLEECSKTGTYKNREVEGFVIRCKKNGDDFFFKYKFEEPYLLYRHFREITKRYIKNEKSISLTMPTIKRNVYVSLKYLEFIDRHFAKDDNTWAEKYLEGHGIIELRELFVKDFHQGSGIELLKFSEMDEKMNNLSITEYKYVIIPIATIGCGKTTVFHTLSDLFGWAHIQNDNISTSATKNKFVEMGLDALITNDAVLLDRNNHQFRERKQLYDSFLSLKDKCLPSNVGLKFILVNFIDESLSQDELWNITFNRIKDRGDNHQCIKVNEDEALARSIMKGFITRFQPLETSKEPDLLFDLTINLKLSDGSLKNTTVVCQSIHQHFPKLIKELPSESQFEKSFEKALNYKPSFTKVFSNSKSEKREKKKKVTYFGISISRDLLLESIKSIVNLNSTWTELVDLNRIQEEFHVTLGHRLSTKNNSANSEKWTKMNKMFNADSITFGNERKQKLDFFADVCLKNLILSEKELVCVEVEIVKVYSKNKEELEVPFLNKHLHVTVGTFSPDIKPMKSNAVLEDLYFDKTNISEDCIVDVRGKSIQVIRFNEETVFYNQQIIAFL